MIPWGLLLNRYVIATALVVGAISFAFVKGASWSTQRAAEKAATATIDNLKSRGRINADIAAATKDDLCRRLDADRWNPETQACE